MAELVDQTALVGSLPALSGALTAKQRSNLSLHSLLCACRLSEQIGRVERENTEQPFGEFWEEILQCSIGVAMLSVAALESSANEYLADEVLETASLPPFANKVLYKALDRESVLSKFDFLLQLRSGKGLERGSNVVQNAELLIKVRNAVVHFRPEWLGESGAHADLSTQLKRRFEPSMYFSEEQLFPRAWASRSFSVWALKSTVNFIEHFAMSSGLENKLSPFREKLTRLSDGAV